MEVGPRHNTCYFRGVVVLPRCLGLLVVSVPDFVLRRCQRSSRAEEEEVVAGSREMWSGSMIAVVPGCARRVWRRRFHALGTEVGSGRFGSSAGNASAVLVVPCSCAGGLRMGCDSRPESLGRNYHDDDRRI